MNRDELLNRLEGVKLTGLHSGLALCPAHEDKHASLSWSEPEPEMWLLHCFAGCGVDEIASAIGMPLSALFPPRAPEQQYRQSLRRPIPAESRLAGMFHEGLVVAQIAQRIGYGIEPLSAAERARLDLAVQRIGEWVPG